MNKKAILLPIQPRWCELIAAGKKKYELRKNAPKCDFPVTVYIYQSKHKWTYSIYNAIADLQGKVIGKFTLKQTHFIADYKVRYVLDGLDNMVDYWSKDIIKESCVPIADILNYCKGGIGITAWKIDDLVIFDKPLNLSDFGLSRAPQNYCFVGEIV